MLTGFRIPKIRFEWRSHSCQRTRTVELQGSSWPDAGTVAVLDMPGGDDGEDVRAVSERRGMSSANDTQMEIPQTNRRCTVCSSSCLMR